MKIQEFIKELQEQNVRLVAVSKTRSIQSIMELYDLGIRDFGENRVKELAEKQKELPEDIRWHMIGHLQSKKLKHIIDFVELIHSVDRMKLLEKIQSIAASKDIVVNILLQFKIATEESKYGFSLDAFQADSFDPTNYPNVNFCGVMAMASFSNDEAQVQKEFKSLKSKFDSLKSEFFENDSSFKEISMGMSGDYKTAIEEGSTMVRIGSLLFS